MSASTSLLAAYLIGCAVNNEDPVGLAEEVFTGKTGLDEAADRVLFGKKKAKESTPTGKKNKQ